ncbi:hypothetical protein JW859_14105 [bacterium]|nr:hypothetical protein [bacterium]
MKLYRISTIICTVLAATLSFTGCGGTGGATPVVSGAETLDTEERMPRQLDCLGSSMKVQRAYDYDKAGYPCADNVTLVPVAGNLSPDPAAAGRYKINTLAEGDELKARLDVDGDTQVLTHLHYDAEQWALKGVASKNVWGTRDFVGGVVPLRPGLAMLYSMPVGDSQKAVARGEFAEVCFAPRSKQVSEIYEYPDGYSKQGVLWIYPNATLGWNSCAINFRMDGAPGDLSSKDEELLGIGERTGVAFDNYVHDVVLDGFGYQYNGDIWNATLTLSWHEFFRGDHDSDGIVTVSDLTPIGQYWAENNTDHWANREVTDVSSYGYVNLMDALADDSPDPVLKTDYRFQNHSLNSFWFVEDGVPPAGVAYGYEVDSEKNAPADATDSNWDGFVRDWYNWNDPELGEQESNMLDAYYDMPALGLYHPGDSPAVGLNLDHALSGYCVWCVKQGSPVSLTSPEPLKIYCREYDGISFEEPETPADDWTAKLWDSTLGRSITVARYPALEANQVKPRFELCFTSPEELGGLAGYGSFDIVIRPYYYDQVNHKFIFGRIPMDGVLEDNWSYLETRISNAVTKQNPGAIPEEYGPVYRGYEEATPENAYPYVADTGAIISVEQLGQQPEKGQQPEHDGFTYEFKVVNADDVEPDAQQNPVFGTSRVLYEVYAYYAEGYNGEDTSLVFTSNNLVGTHEEGSPGEYGGIEEGESGNPDFVRFPLQIDPSEHSSLPLFEDGKVLWFGVRARELDFLGNGTADDEIEYSHPDFPEYLPNDDLEWIEIQDRFPPYFVSKCELRKQEKPTMASTDSFFAGSDKMEEGALLHFNPAIDPGNYNSAEAITYELYVTASIMDHLPYLQTPVDTKTLAFDSIYDEDMKRRSGLLDSESYEFDVLVDVYGNPLEPGEVTCAMVVAKDEHGNYSINNVTRYVGRLPLITPPESLAGPLLRYQARTRGDIESHDGDLHMVFPEPQPYDTRVELGYEYRPRGLPGLTESNILSALPPVNPPANPTNPIVEPVAEFMATEYALTFKSDPSDDFNQRGEIKVDSNEVAEPVICISARDDFPTYDAPYYLFTICKDDYGYWYATYHKQPTDPAAVVAGVGAPDSVYYPYYYWPPEGGVERQGLNTLGWIQEDSYVSWWGQTNPVGDLMHKFGYCETGYWSQGISLWGNEQLLLQSGHLGQRQEERSTDVIMRHPGRCELNTLPNPGHSTTPGDDPPDEIGNTLYMLASTPHSNIANLNTVAFLPQYRWYKSTLAWARRPDIDNDWNTIDLMQALSQFLRSGDNYSFGPNALEVARQPATVENHHVYVTYVNAAKNDDCQTDGRGLRLAYNNCCQGCFNGSWASPNQDWYSPGLIDDTYYFPEIWMDTGTTSLVDIKRKPSATLNGAFAYQGLGCAYLHPGTEEDPGTKIYYAELINNRWVRQEAHPGIADYVDGGNILWVKLEYVDDSSPRIMYASRRSLQSQDYYVRLWEP